MISPGAGRFGRAAEYRSGEALPLVWLAGLLEAEGSFLKPAPSAPNQPIVVCRMTDEDVVKRAAVLLGAKVLSIDKGRHRREHSARIKGSRALTLMRDLRPLLGTRRRAAIDEALAAVTPTPKLSYEIAQIIRTSRQRGESVSALSRQYGVSRASIRSVVRSEIHQRPPELPWTAALPELRGHRYAPMTRQELYWLAGWLEGEGSFLRPPPSDPRRSRIVGQSRDRDVVDEVARLLGVTPTTRVDPRGQARGWSTMYEALLRGPKAAALMLALLPLLGRRRSEQVRRSLATGDR